MAAKYTEPVDVVYTKYKCVNCGALDSDRTDKPPTCLSCWQCASGRNMGIQDQINNSAGMFPYDGDVLPAPEADGIH